MSSQDKSIDVNNLRPLDKLMFKYTDFLTFVNLHLEVTFFLDVGDFRLSAGPWADS